MKKQIILFALLTLLPIKALSLTFGALGDSRGGHNIHKSLLNIAEKWKAEIVFNTGDMITNPGNREEWKEFWTLFGNTPFKYYLVAGNHDINSEKSKKVYIEEVNLPENELYYKVEKDGVLFVVLNSVDPKENRKITGKQFKWLEKTLNPEKYKFQFVFLHHPVFTEKHFSHYKKGLDDYPELRDRFHKLMINKKVSTVFTGHEHTYERKIIDGVPYIITGGGGAKLYGKDAFCHIIIGNVLDDRIRFKVIDWHGQTRKEFTIYKK